MFFLVYINQVFNLTMTNVSDLYNYSIEKNIRLSLQISYGFLSFSYLRYEVKAIEAFAFLDLTPSLVYYRAAGYAIVKIRGIITLLQKFPP